jgi:hypothetical protein
MAQAMKALALMRRLFFRRTLLIFNRGVEVTAREKKWERTEHGLVGWAASATRMLPRETEDKSNNLSWSLWPIHARCADVVAIDYIAAKTSVGSAQTGLFTLPLCNQAHPWRMPRSI